METVKNSGNALKYILLELRNNYEIEIPFKHIDE
jgi:hypothetical protein